MSSLGIFARRPYTIVPSVTDGGVLGGDELGPAIPSLCEQGRGRLERDTEFLMGTHDSVKMSATDGGEIISTLPPGSALRQLRAPKGRDGTPPSVCGLPCCLADSGVRPAWSNRGQHRWWRAEFWRRDGRSGRVPALDTGREPSSLARQSKSQPTNVFLVRSWVPTQGAKAITNKTYMFRSAENN